jgi:two-component system, cell cycle sensor histidine kinase and response regulator CckA
LRRAARQGYRAAVGEYDPAEFLGEAHRALLLQGVLSALPNYVALIDRQRRVLFLNRTLSRELCELIGKPIEDYIAATNRDAVIACVELAFSSGQRQMIDYDVFLSSGQTRHLTAQVLPRRDESGQDIALLVTSDLTDRRRLEAELQRSEEFRRTVVEHLPDFVTLLDREHRFIWVNRLASGLSLPDVIGSKIEEFLAPESAGATGAAIDAAFERGVTGQCEAEGYRDESSMRWVLNRVVPIHLNGKVDSALLITSDISDLKQAERALREKEQQLHHAQRLESIGQLAGGIAHDFNNLLQVIEGNLHFIRDGVALGENVDEELAQALRAAHGAAELTSRLLAVGRRKRVDPTRVDLGLLTAASMRMLRAAIPESINLVYEAPAVAYIVQVDAPEFEQVLINLCVNARDAMPNGGNLRVWIEPQGDDHVLLNVADDGVGIPRENLTRVFEPFFSTKGTGSGLGLAVAAGIIAAHGGTISAESDGVCGATLRVRLPRHEGGLRSARPVSVSPQGGTATILVAEDEVLVRTQVVRVLRGAGYAVVEAEDGAKAIAAFQAAQGAIDLLLLDAVMPVCNGWQAYLEIERRKPGIKALFTTGYAANVLPADFLEHGARLLSKPFKPAELLAKVRELLHGAVAPAP